jgi:hypothetical protein
MTGQLRTTLHDRADHLTNWDVDLDAIVRDGDRRVRRRRRLAIAGGIASGIAGVLAVVGGVSTLATRDHASRPQPADEVTKPLAYAVGSVIHTGSASVDVGVDVESMVQIDQGFVFTDPQRRVYEEKGGEVHLVRTFDEEVTRADAGSPLAVSDDGRVAVWWDGDQFQSYPGYGLDGKSDSFPAAPTWSNDAPPAVRGVSGGHLYFWNGRQTMIAEIPPLRSTAFWPDSGLSGPQAVQDAGGDRVLVRVGDGLAVVKANLRPLDAAALSDWEPGTDLTGVRPQVSGVSTGDLSPDGKYWFSHDNDEFAVYDSANGHRQDPAHPGFDFAAPYQWLDNDTVAVLATKGSSDDPQISLLTCHVSTNDCQVTAPDIGGYDDIVIPVGQPLVD